MGGGLWGAEGGAWGGGAMGGRDSPQIYIWLNWNPLGEIIFHNSNPLFTDGVTQISCLSDLLGDIYLMYLGTDTMVVIKMDTMGRKIWIHRGGDASPKPPHPPWGRAPPC